MNPIFDDDFWHYLPRQVYVKEHMNLALFYNNAIAFCKTDYPRHQAKIVNPRHSYYRCVPDKENGFRFYFDVEPRRGAAPCTVAEVVEKAYE